MGGTLKMCMARLLLLVLWIAVAPLALATPAVSPASSLEGHDKGWWRAIAANDFAPPETASLELLLQELSGYLAIESDGRARNHQR